MELAKNEYQLVSNMIMCGDHPSVTKAELNAKESKPEEANKVLASHARLSPQRSTTERTTGATLERSRAVSEHALRALEARRRARSLELAERADVDAHANRALVQAAMGSFRWPPYLLCVWVLVLALTHALHCLVAVLDAALPAIRKVCNHLRTWTEDSWRRGNELNHRALPAALACATGALFVVYAALYAARAAAVWAVEPLCADADVPDSPKITDYDDLSRTDLKRAD